MNSDVNQAELKESMHQKSNHYIIVIFSANKNTNQIDSIFNDVKKKQFRFYKVFSVRMTI
jgi:tetrahydromethanopterin S-methyltransferase subunit F